MSARAGEHSTGEKHRRVSSRAGNALVRRLLVETAWQYRHRPGIGIALARRRTDNPANHRDRRQGAAARSPLPRLPTNTSPRPRLWSPSRELVGFLWRHCNRSLSSDAIAGRTGDGDEIRRRVGDGREDGGGSEARL
jgi:hypothetical protein